MDTSRDISRDLFLRSQDTNWSLVYEVCCGRRPIGELPVDWQPVVDQVIGGQLSPRSLRRYLRALLSAAVECYQTRPEEEPLVNVFVFVLTLLDLGVQVDGQRTARFATDDSHHQISLKTKLAVFTHAIQQLIQRFRHLSLAKTIDLSPFVGQLLDNTSDKDIDEEVLVRCFGQIIEIDYELIASRPQLLKQVLIRCNIRSEDSDELNGVRTEVYITLFDVYFKSKKALKLHQLLNELSAHLSPQLMQTTGQLSRLYGRCVLELPYGQTLELWTLFLSEFKAKHHFWTKLLTQFLRHIRCLDDSIPQQFVPKTTGLLSDTKSVLKTTTKTLAIDDEELMHNLLDLYHSFESLAIWRMNYNRNDVSLEEKWSHIQQRPNEWYDLSFVYDFAEDFDWKSMFDGIDGLSPRIQRLLLKSLCQKYQIWKCLQLNANLSDDQKSAVKGSVDELLTSLMANFCSNDLRLLTPQDVTAIIDDLNRKNISLLANSLMTTAVNEDPEDNSNDYEVRRHLVNENIWENITFQTAFVSAFWRQIGVNFGHKKKRKLDAEDIGIQTSINNMFEALTSNSSVWFKYATQPPLKTATKDNKMWSIIADVCQQTEQLIQRSESIPPVKVPVKLIQLFSQYVPLEYLLPANQIRCLLCLSMVLFSIDMTLEKNVLIADLILDSILRIFDGVRSVWFFRFVNPSVYLIKCLKCLATYVNREKLRQFVTKLTDNFARNVDQTVELKDKLRDNEDNVSNELLVMTETILLKQYLRVLNMTSVPRYLLAVKEISGSITRELSHTIHTRIKSHLSTDDSGVESLDSVLIVDSFAAVFEFQVLAKSAVMADEDTVYLKTRWRKLLTKLIDVSVNRLAIKSPDDCCVKFLALLCGHRKKLANILPEDLTISLLNVLCPNEEVDETVQRSLDSFRDIKLTDVWHKRDSFVDIFGKMQSCEDIMRDGFLSDISNRHLFADCVKPLVVALIKCNSGQEFEQLMQMLLKPLNCQNFLDVSHALSLWLAVFDSDFHLCDEKRDLFDKHLTELLTLCSIWCQRCNQNDCKLSPEFQLYIKVPALQVVRHALHVMSSRMTSAQVSLGLQTCIDARLSDYELVPKLFHPLFDCIYSALNEVLLKHKYIAIASMSAYHSMVTNLMRGLMSVSCEQRFVVYELADRHALEICSKNMDRLLTLTAGLGDDYVPFAPHLMAAYVSHAERVAVHSTVKKNIMSGLNRILKLMSSLGAAGGSNAIEMLYSRLTDSKRQIFKLIFDNFDKYYKFKGQI